MVLFFYIAVPFLILWFIFKVLFGRIRARTLIFLSFMACLSYWLSFATGALISFGYEPASYWHSMVFDFSSFDAHVDAVNNLLEILPLPYYFYVSCLKLSLYILWTHFTVGFLIAYTLGVSIMVNWIRVVLRARALRNPRRGFGSDAELDKMDKMFNQKNVMIKPY